MASGPAADAAAEEPLDSFSLLLPLPYRVAFIITLGIWAWGMNIYYLAALRIDITSLIKYSSRAGPGNSHHQRIFRLASTASIFLAISLVLFWLITQGNKASVQSWEILPQSYLLLLIILFALPLQRLSKQGRYRFLATLRRISIGGIAENQDGKFGDILLADALTSYAKVLGDLFVSTCMLFSGGVSSTSQPERFCGGPFFVPLIMSIPSVIRLRQCLIEYGRVRRRITASSGWGGQHLANALKYSSAFPVIILSALQRNYDPAKLGLTEAGLYRLWLLAVVLNSIYSFYWDVAKDWDLTLFSSSVERNDAEHPWGLRGKLHFRPYSIYYVAIALDLILRCTWSLKLSPHLDHFNDLESCIFLMEFLEVFRRWVWIFFRVETEWVRLSREPLQEDILLDQYERNDYDKVDIE